VDITLMRRFFFAVVGCALCACASAPCKESVVAGHQGEFGLDRAVITSLDRPWSSTRTLEGVALNSPLAFQDLCPGRYVVSVHDVVGNSASTYRRVGWLRWRGQTQGRLAAPREAQAGAPAYLDLERPRVPAAPKEIMPSR
jgi:hypothetical protein